MPPIPREGLVAVTGAAGFIGGWVVRLLLEKGYRVRACVRDVNDAAKCDFLKAMPGYASGRLTLHSANLDQDGCFDEIFKGCQGVAHVAHITDYMDEAYVRRVCDHIIASVNKSGSVTRVVVTSSVAAVMDEVDLNEFLKRPVLYEDRYPDESNPKRVQKTMGYSMGKIHAQRSFSDAAAKSGFWDAITCCPADNVGPIQSAHQKNMGPWQHLIELMLRGKPINPKIGPGLSAFRPWNIVDVRDDALSHIGLLESVRVRNGERYISWSTERFTPEEICQRITELLPEMGFVPSKDVVKYSENARKREDYFRGVWRRIDLRNDRIRDATGVTFRPFDESLRDCVESLLTVAKVPLSVASKL